MEIKFETGALVACPCCNQTIVGSDCTDSHGECEHLSLIHVPVHDDAKPMFIRGDAFREWWNGEGLPDLWQSLPTDTLSIDLFGIKNLSPNVARVLGAYARCPHLDCIVLQEDQGSGPSSGCIGPVLFGFSKGEKSSGTTSQPPSAPPSTTQKWVRTLVEVYTVRGDVDPNRLMDLGRGTSFDCDSFFTDEEDGYNGGNAEDGRFSFSAQDMEIRVLELRGQPSGERLLVRISTIGFNVEVPGQTVPYEKIMFAVETSVGAERLTEVEQACEGPEPDVLKLEEILEAVFIEANTVRLSPTVVSL